MDRRLRSVLLLAGLMTTLVGATGCTQVMETVLELQEGSSAVIQLGATPLTSDFVGGIDATAEITISLFDILFGRPLDGTVEINELLIAGTPINIIGFSTGAVCVSPLDPNEPGGGTIEVDLKRRKLTLNVVSLAGIRITDPLLGPQVGVLEFPVEVSAETPVSLIDLLGALGGGSLPIDFTQEVSFVINQPGSPFNGATVTGQFILAQTDAFPTDPLIDDCRALLAGL